MVPPYVPHACRLVTRTLGQLTRLDTASRIGDARARNEALDDWCDSFSTALEDVFGPRETELRDATPGEHRDELDAVYEIWVQLETDFLGLRMGESYPEEHRKWPARRDAHAVVLETAADEIGGEYGGCGQVLQDAEVAGFPPLTSLHPPPPLPGGQEVPPGISGILRVEPGMPGSRCHDRPGAGDG